jgi:death-on-curing protein
VGAPIWIEKDETLIIHDLQLAEHGGREGIRDLRLLESALARPKNLFAYSAKTPSLPRLAAAYASGIAANHPFVDGNKRTALVVALTFLELNGLEIDASQEEIYLAFLHLAAGRISEEGLAEWLREHAKS